MAVVVIRAGSSSPSPKKGEFANSKEKGRKRVVAMKSKGDTMVLNSKEEATRN